MPFPWDKQWVDLQDENKHLAAQLDVQIQSNISTAQRYAADTQALLTECRRAIEQANAEKLDAWLWARAWAEFSGYKPGQPAPKEVVELYNSYKS